MPSFSYLPQVRRQYELYPYPERDPEEEKRRLSITSFDGLGKINHYCYRGSRDFSKGFRVLIAGGGTGDALIYLAEQLRETDARLVYLDISEASMTIAKRRAEIRKLNRIEWISGSILDLPRLGLGLFDYINCTGVLHHLADPAAGLACLRDALADEGAMGIMVYGQYGRTGIYHIQALMRLINQGEADPRGCVENTKAAVKCLPPTNWFKKAEAQFPKWNENDIEVYDLFLHSQDRAYTVPQLYAWVEDCGLRLVDFCERKLMYRPEYALRNPSLQQKIASLPLRDRQAIAELAFGALSKHSFYISRQEDTIARVDDLESIPFLTEGIPHMQLMAAVQSQPAGSPITLNIREDRFTIQNTPLTPSFFRALDGTTRIGTMIQAIQSDPEFAGNPPACDQILKEFARFFNTLHLLDCLFLRHQSVPPYPSLQELQDRVTGMYM